jgi:hypothetical protein
MSNEKARNAYNNFEKECERAMMTDELKWLFNNITGPLIEKSADSLYLFSWSIGRLMRHGWTVEKLEMYFDAIVKGIQKL